MRKIHREIDPAYAACPIRNVIDKFGDKWSLLVLYHLSQKGVMRFNEMRREMTDISQKMLAQTLRNLEADHLVERRAYPTVPPSTDYRLTELGQSLIPHISALIGWAVEHFDDVNTPQK